MNNVVLFAGTTEGRRIAEALRGTEISLLVSVATEYGETLIHAADNIRVLHGRKDEAEIGSLLRTNGADLVIDATHPYAKEITKTLRAVCGRIGVPCLRVLRKETDTDTAGCVFVGDAGEAAAYLDGTEGNVLLTTGSKELPAFAAVRNAKDRLYARILPIPEAVRAAEELGYAGAHLLCMQGPFGEEMNEAMLRHVNARFLVTKDTGEAGGFPEKIRAAVKCGAVPVVIRRPEEEDGMSAEECLAYLSKRFGLSAARKKVTVVGAGTGSYGTLTLDAEAVLREAELIIGAPRLIDALSRFRKQTVPAVRAEEIAKAVSESPARKIVCVMSGDTGFCSGAKKLLPYLAPYETAVLPGISSVSAFAAKIGVSWDDACLASAHGRSLNLPAKVRKNRKVFVLAGGQDGVVSLLRTLCEYGFGKVSVTVGEDISLDREKITKGTAEALAEGTYGSLALLYIENPEAGGRQAVPGWPDEAFLRGDVPMTKMEVRAVSLAKLCPGRDAVVWDVGAGTGSVSLEAAALCEDGMVYAVEEKEEACRLIEENKRHLGISNVTVIRGRAPECLSDLPAPACVFIGGSGGGLSAILRAALIRNPRTRIVLNTVTAETFAEAVTCLKTLPVRAAEITQVSVSRGRRAGAYTLMTAQNPVTVICCEGDPGRAEDPGCKGEAGYAEDPGSTEGEGHV